METPRISASSYSNTAPLIWSFLYGSRHGSVELILDNAPARSAELLSQDRVDAALVPVIAYQQLDRIMLIPDVCVGARERVRSVCLVTGGKDLEDVRSVALDASSKTSVALTKIIFREFLGFEPAWNETEPDIDAMLSQNDAALLIGDPALKIAEFEGRNPTRRECVSSEPRTHNDESLHQAFAGDSSSLGETPSLPVGFLPSHSALKKFDLAELWRRYTDLGFVFAMWMTRGEVAIDFAAARDEGLLHLNEIVSNYQPEIGLSRDELTRYLSENISYSVDDSMQKGMELFFKLAGEHGLIESVKPIRYLE